jgi:uncharacterized membrane protein YhhN
MAHAAYIFTFLKGYTFAFYQIYIMVIVISSLIVTSVVFKFKTTGHKIAVGIYSVITSATMIIAIGNLGGYVGPRGILISLGATLFWLSDMVLGIHLFRKKIKFHTLFIWGLYAPGQLLIALSCFY